jgi:AmmeMemoRadiSam system protein B
MTEFQTAEIRRPGQAGRFYPASPARLRQEVETLLSTADPPEGPAPKALIAPHAGYEYSGPVAASGYALLARDRPHIRRVILLGPAHWADFDGVAASEAGAFATPLGTLPVDEAGWETAVSLPGVTVWEEAHRPEHSLEVHLPFLQVALGEVAIVPLLVGRASAGEVARIIEALWGGPETRVIVSSDLSHYHDYATARRRDAATARAIEQLNARALADHDACGHRPIRGLLSVASRRGMRCRTLDLRNSGDTAGGHDRVVGYGTFAFEEPSSDTASA